MDLQPLVQSVPITTKVGSSHPAHDDVYSMQHYVIKFVSDFRQVGGFLRGYTNKTDESGVKNNNPKPPMFLLSFFFWLLDCMPFFDLRRQITSLVSSNYHFGIF